MLFWTPFSSLKLCNTCKCTTVLHPPRNIACGKTSTCHLPAVFFCGVSSCQRKLCLSTAIKYSFSDILYLRVGKNTLANWFVILRHKDIVGGKKKQEAVIKGYIINITIMIPSPYIYIMIHYKCKCKKKKIKVILPCSELKNRKISCTLDGSGCLLSAGL